MLLANPDWSDRAIAESCKVSVHTIAAVREREASTIEARKKTLTSVLVDVATLGAEQMERKIGRSSLRDATIATGVSVDKVLALQGQSPVGVQVAVVNLPTPEQREDRQRAHDALDEITRLLHEPKPLTPEKQLLLKVMLKKLSLTGPQDKPGKLPPISNAQD